MTFTDVRRLLVLFPFEISRHVLFNFSSDAFRKSYNQKSYVRWIGSDVRWLVFWKFYAIELIRSLLVWFFVRYLASWNIAYSMLVESIARTTKHAFKVLAYSLPTFKRKYLAIVLKLVKFIQTFVVFFFTLEALVGNSCNFPVPFCWWLLLQCFFLTKSLGNKRSNSTPKEVI